MTQAAATNAQSARDRRRWACADHEARRELIVDTALDLLARNGLDGVSMRRVAQRLGVGAMTLYTYIDGQDELRRQMIDRGFKMLAAGCSEASTLGTPGKWRGGARHYLMFAIENPNLYELMFRHPLPGDQASQRLMQDGIHPLFEKVRAQMEDATDEAELDRRVREAAGRFWIALHGLASLAIADRLNVLDRSLDELLDDLLERVAPT
jgi:AcrR family transcriptional regulator